MAYRNYMEDAVAAELNNVIDDIKGIFKCEKCREDIAAYVLNRVPAKYVVTYLGNVYTKFEQLQVQARADIIVKLMEAAKVVKAKPRH